MPVMSTETVMLEVVGVPTTRGIPGGPLGLGLAPVRKGPPTAELTGGGVSIICLSKEVVISAGRETGCSCPILRWSSSNSDDLEEVRGSGWCQPPIDVIGGDGIASSNVGAELHSHLRIRAAGDVDGRSKCTSRGDVATGSREVGNRCGLSAESIADGCIEAIDRGGSESLNCCDTEGGCRIGTNDGDCGHGSPKLGASGGLIQHIVHERCSTDNTESVKDDRDNGSGRRCGEGEIGGGRD